VAIGGATAIFREGHGVRFSNPANLDDYRTAVTSDRLTRIDEHVLTQQDAMEEHLFLGLRLSDGVSLHAFEREFGRPLESVYGSVVADLRRLGLLYKNGNMLALTQRGMLLSNQVFARFL